MTIDAAALSIPAPTSVADARPRERLLEAATLLFCRYGINATGIDAVVHLAGTAKTTLYKLFGSKDGLVEAVLEAEGRQWRDWFLNGLDEGGGDARARLDRIFPLLKEWFAQDRFYGCPFINAVGEHDKADSRMRTIALRHKKVVLGRLQELTQEAGAADPVLVAHQLGLLIDGAIVAAMVLRDSSVADAARPAAAALLDACCHGGVNRVGAAPA
jgi:AcrR family transcriptional regulator